jgi:non-canonical (house-cleaning) NTP pyrophosphatase
MKQRIVGVAGTNELKVRATQLACDRLNAALGSAFLSEGALNAVGVKVAPTEVFEQPIGIEETLRGAQRRAEAVWNCSDPSYAVGIENGILYASNGTWIDLAVICVIGTGSGLARPAYATCPGIRVTSEDVGISIATRQTRTAGSFIGAREGCDPADWHRKFTGGLTSREKLLSQGVFLAFATLLNGH